MMTTSPLIHPFSRLFAWVLLASMVGMPGRTRAQPVDLDAPFRVSETRRYLVDSHGTPFLLQGDAAWSLIANTTNEEAKEYLQNRKAKGFNAILVNLIEHKFAKNAPKDLYGEAPFQGASDLGAPNERYFEHADWVI